MREHACFRITTPSLVIPNLKFTLQVYCHNVPLISENQFQGLKLQSDLYLAATLGTLKSGRLIEIGRLTEVQHKLDRKGPEHDVTASI